MHGPSIEQILYKFVPSSVFDLAHIINIAAMKCKVTLLFLITSQIIYSHFLKRANYFHFLNTNNIFWKKNNIYYQKTAL